MVDSQTTTATTIHRRNDYMGHGSDGGYAESQGEFRPVGGTVQNAITSTPDWTDSKLAPSADAYLTGEQSGARRLKPVRSSRKEGLQGMRCGSRAHRAGS